MIGRILLIVLAIAVWPGFALGKDGDDAASSKRVALVVGNGAYDDSGSVLQNPANDATAIAAKLRGLGIEVIEALDLDYQGMRNTLREFDRALQGAEAGLFYYAGHAMEYRGQNYLLPTDAILETEGDVGLGLIDMDQVLQVMETAVPTRLVFLDACRNNPLARNFRRSLGGSREASVGRGLARIQTAVGTFIAYATAPGDVAADGKQENSPFTTAMLTHLGQPGLEISQLMQHVRNSVIEATKEKQVPWDSSSLRGPFILNLNLTINTPGSEPPPMAPIAIQRADTAFWKSINRASVEGSDTITLRVDLVEANRETMRKLGFNWRPSASNLDFLVGQTDARVNRGNVDGSSNTKFSNEVAEQMNDLQESGLVKLLASPNLSLRYGEPGSFLAGGEIPVPVPGRDGSDETTIDYKPFGISFDFKAERLPRKRINLSFRSDVSTLDQRGGIAVDGTTYPTLLRQAAEADFQLEHGQTVGLAGLYGLDAPDVGRFPMLGDVPVLGALFRSERFHQKETELIILLTPHLIDTKGETSSATNRISGYQAYLERFGEDGLYSPLARAWISDLKQERERLTKSEAKLDLDRHQLQEALLTLGYDIGEADGVFGPRTREGISAWQESNYVDATGYLSTEQIRRILEEASSASENP